MIDKVTLKLPIVIDKRILSRHRWDRNEDPSEYNPDVINVYYFYKMNNVSIRYHENKHMLRVEGRFINFSKVPNRVYNLDKLYGGLVEIWATAEVIDMEYKYFYQDSNGKWQYEELEPEYDYTIHGYAQNLDDVLNEINTLLYELTETELDIRDFRIEKIEVCFNLYTEYVEQYIELFNGIYKEMTDPRYANFVFKQHRQPYTSFYVKTKGEYEKNSRQNYTVNFYNKLDQLLFLKDKNYYGAIITDHDLDLARNVLRMEVQVNYYYLKNVFKKKGLDFTTRAFFQLIDIDLCADIIKDKYRFFIDKNMCLDFYSYRAAKDIVERSDLTRKKKDPLLDYMLKRSRNNNKSITDYERKKFKEMLADLGIHNYFIPKSKGIDYLPSPMKLLDEKVEDINQRRAEYIAEENPYDFLGYYRYQLKQLKTL